MLFGAILYRPFTTAMSLQDPGGFFLADTLFPEITDGLARGPRCLFMVADRRSVGVAAKALLLGGRHQPGGMDHFGGYACQFRDPATDKVAVRVQLLALHHRIINPEGVDAGEAGLHLGLGVMDANMKMGRRRILLTNRPAPLDSIH